MRRTSTLLFILSDVEGKTMGIASTPDTNVKIPSIFTVEQGSPLIFNELLEGAKEKEEKEAKRRKRLADDLYDFFLYSSKEITASSSWEDFKSLVEDRFTWEESFFQEIFDEVITELKDKSKEEGKRKEEKAKKGKRERKRRSGREKKNREKEGCENRKGRERFKKNEKRSEESESHCFEENGWSGRGKDKKHQKRHRDSFDNDDLTLIDIVSNTKTKAAEKNSLTSDIDSGSQHETQEGLKAFL
ncbi:Hypothetical predicted protein [Olea europaea subsp. europaea]|uniref:FF domain-containing protein n=1 Tax=Olea europaea subsp. europaea TaxID=158383 RepID=A0A8S0UCF5_OLEEU|nr:Hypothetical predicted protein [Olea europaea subsp. europaea]